MFIVAVKFPRKYGLLSLPEDEDASVYLKKIDKYEEILWDYMVITGSRKFLYQIMEIVKKDMATYLKLLDRIHEETEKIGAYLRNQDLSDILSLAKISFMVDRDKNNDSFYEFVQEYEVFLEIDNSYRDEENILYDAWHYK